MKISKRDLQKLIREQSDFEYTQEMRDDPDFYEPGADDNELSGMLEITQDDLKETIFSLWLEDVGVTVSMVYRWYKDHGYDPEEIQNAIQLAFDAG